MSVQYIHLPPFRYDQLPLSQAPERVARRYPWVEFARPDSFNIHIAQEVKIMPRIGVRGSELQRVLPVSAGAGIVPFGIGTV